MRRIERREQDDLRTRPGDGDVEPSLAAGLDQRPEVQRQPAGVRVRREREREQDDVALVALDVLEVLDEQLFAVARKRCGDERSSPHSSRRSRIRSRCWVLNVTTPIEASGVAASRRANLVDDRGRLDTVDALTAAFELSVDAPPA